MNYTLLQLTCRTSISVYTCMLKLALSLSHLHVCIRICMYIYICSYTHLYIHTYIHTHVFTSDACMQTYTAHKEIYIYTIHTFAACICQMDLYGGSCMGVSENRGPLYSTRNSRIPIHYKDPKMRYPYFGNSRIPVQPGRTRFRLDLVD